LVVRRTHGSGLENREIEVRRSCVEKKCNLREVAKSEVDLDHWIKENTRQRSVEFGRKALRRKAGEEKIKCLRCAK
jgi:hypothetical protein